MNDTAARTPDPTLTAAMTTAIDRLATDEEFRWSWWCNLVMASVDVGIRRDLAEASAGQFLYVLTSGNDKPPIRMWEDPMLAKDRIDRYGPELKEQVPNIGKLRSVAVEIIEKLRSESVVELIEGLEKNLEDEFTHWSTEAQRTLSTLKQANSVLYPAPKG